MKAKTKLAKLCSILLVLVMVVGMLPTVALAEEAPPTEPAKEKADFSTDPGNALGLLNAAMTGTEASTWDGKTLTLNGVNFTTTASTAVKLPAGSEIVLNGDNIITSGVASSQDSFGIYASGDLTIRGAGKLDVTGGTATDEDGDDSYGIYTVGSLTISEDADVTANGGTATDASCGIEAEGDVTIIGGTVKVTGGASNDYNSYGIYGENVIISGGTVNATGGTATNGSSYGIYASTGLTISGTAKVKATGGTATNGNSYGIYSGYSGTSTNAISISGSANVTAKGGEATNYSSYGIYAVGGVTISGTVNATGGTATNGSSYGIYAFNGLTISGAANVTAKGGAAKNSYGIYANTGLTISGDNTVVTATGGEASNKSKGIFANSNSVTIKGGQVEATGGKAGDDSYGIDSSSVAIEGGTVTAKGGEATNANGYSYGIGSLNAIKISGGTTSVTATGGKATNGSSYGIYANSTYGSISVSDGTVTAKAGSATTASALSQKPRELPNAYQWRISESGVYTQFSDSASAYTWNAAHTYVEIRDTAPAATTYTVTFDANGGSGTMTAATGVPGEYTLPANGFTAPAGKRFKCWSVNGTEKAVGDKITVAADTTVKAVWETIVTAVWETIPATSTEYDILDGANSSWTQNSDGSLSIRGSGAFSEFVGVKVDGKSVDEQYYTVKEGSTIVTLKAEYLSTLAAGPHTIQLIWKDGTASTTFNINVNNPNTGDNGGLAMAAALLALSAAAIAASGFNRKRGKSSR